MSASYLVTYALSKAGPMTVMQLAVETGESERNIREYVNREHKAKRIHIHAWDVGANHCPIAVYASGDGVDVAKPPKKVKERVLSDHPKVVVKPSYYTRKRHPTVEKLANSIDTSNPFSTAMWNVSQGVR